MIWEQVYEEWSSGAHRFQLLHDPKSDTKLVMRPDNDQKDDASAWRERLALSKIDPCSCYVFHHRQRDTRKRKRLRILYKDTAYSRRVRVEENGVIASIDTETDLVAFRFKYGATQVSLVLLQSAVENKDIFAGITQVGIDMEFFTKGHSKSKNTCLLGFRAILATPVGLAIAGLSSSFGGLMTSKSCISYLPSPLPPVGKS